MIILRLFMFNIVIALCYCRAVDEKSKDSKLNIDVSHGSCYLFPFYLFIYLFICFIMFMFFFFWLSINFFRLFTVNLLNLYSFLIS